MTAHSSPDINELSAHSAEDQHPPPPDSTLEPDPTEPTPAYTPRPTAVEQTVVRGPPTAAELTASVSYNAKRFSVSFGGQSVGRTAARGPEYSKGSKIRGSVQVGEKYLDQVLGTIKLSIHDSGSTNTTFLNHTIRLHPTDQGPSFSPPCPKTLSFKWPLPTTYVDTWGQTPTKRTRPLPPTYELTVMDVPGLRARVRYEVVVTVRWKWKGILGRKESLSTPFTYVPYVPHPQHAHTSVISTLKSCPGEWASHTERVPTRSPDVGEIMSSLVLPTPPLHPLSQAIPFHFQLSAECPPPTRRGRRLSISSGTSKLSASKTTTGAKPPNNNNIPIALLAEPAVLRLQIQRQISVDVRGARALRVICGGVGRMERVVLGSRRSGCEVVYEGQVSGGAGPSSAPPAYTSLRRTNSLRSILSAGTTGGGSIMGPLPPGVERVRDDEGGKDWFAIAWEGSVTPEKDVLQVGGFRAGGLLIKDFVTLTLVPPTPELSPLRALQQAVPIRCILVSEAEMQASMSGGW